MLEQINDIFVVFKTVENRESPHLPFWARVMRLTIKAIYSSLQMLGWSFNPRICLQTSESRSIQFECGGENELDLLYMIFCVFHNNWLLFSTFHIHSSLISINWNVKSYLSDLYLKPEWKNGTWKTARWFIITYISPCLGRGKTWRKG